MDCYVISTMLNRITREADRAKEMLGGGNTGKEFHAALADIEHAVNMIRAQWDVRNVIINYHKSDDGE